MGRDFAQAPEGRLHVISIHSPRMGRDSGGGSSGMPSAISIHSPRMGRDINPRSPPVTSQAFQSTLPAWGETWGARFGHGNTNFNPLSPHGERPTQAGQALGSDVAFQSTLPAWGETLGTGTTAFRDNFNPLSPHGERPSLRTGRPCCTHFNPLSPHGERRSMINAYSGVSLFQSTLPAWGETKR